ncbi:VacJ family lipoprotein [Frigidibacter sp. RF13]|uniref:MlaA family lipoprotein n=1 Tax=Frigidibacter sp. RF13 TaxID=2997340 RepID=UPI00226F2EEA|nr:VacJ family lipoprotein [Frigidibacter sp. RF13]MCY1126791.1 VacJ family lipoprotein [Frigidibacter sp. RF13]
MFQSLLKSLRRPGVRATFPVLALAALLGACARPEPGAEINDPYERGNRSVHRFNTAVDKFFFGNDEQKGVIPIIPRPVSIGFSNFASNLGQPSAVLNSLLQGKPGPALQNTLRFAVNSTIGIGGLFDPASKIGIPADPADFGETLHVWGVAEGAYLEVPFLGPSTERDLAGTIVDIVIDPVNALVDTNEAAYITVGRLTAKVGNRQRFADTYESILYDSADSYAQARLLYLQNRHFELGIEEETFDPYEDPYAQ